MNTNACAVFVPNAYQLSTRGRHAGTTFPFLERKGKALVSASACFIATTSVFLIGIRCPPTLMRPPALRDISKPSHIWLGLGGAARAGLGRRRVALQGFARAALDLRHCVRARTPSPLLYYYIYICIHIYIYIYMYMYICSYMPARRARSYIIICILYVVYI